MKADNGQINAQNGRKSGQVRSQSDCAHFGQTYNTDSPID